MNEKEYTPSQTDVMLAEMQAALLLPVVIALHCLRLLLPPDNKAIAISYSIVWHRRSSFFHFATSLSCEDAATLAATAILAVHETIIYTSHTAGISR